MAGGGLIPQVPEVCPSWEPGGGACSVSIHHWRERKTGPGFPLAVARCAVHGQGFTLYPPGHAPYQRVAIVGVGVDGRPVLDDRDEGGLQEGEEPVWGGEFAGTVFAAAVDADRGKPWSRCSPSGATEGWWPTQGRHLQVSALLVGVSSDLDDRQREGIAQVLSVETLLLRDEATSVRTNPGYRTMGRAVCRVLRTLRAGARRGLGLLTCGHLAEWWGRPLEWDPRRRVLTSLPFPSMGTATSG